MDRKEFDEVYQDQTLEGVVGKVRIFRDLDLPKIRGELSEGYGHTPEQDIAVVVRFLDNGISKGYGTFRDYGNARPWEYKHFMRCMNLLHDRWQFQL